ncbi:hypothetical protein PpBr36_04238 [Pyricularia pennisetigena]|uniref:hypothetical protein n=1 Tax=Pyricularia pennisetigena TaxID=1578925 RepID=UPI00114DB3F3|nr:hypothetical protein PpBr36_04238 [Pyricularia pennisetigena]TLS27424.1 hypothetical protein PpBr36_04238 [Pyricularia pennisetigena]
MRFSITAMIVTLALGVNAMPAQSEPAAVVNRDVSSTELAQIMRDFKSSASVEAQACDMDWFNTCRGTCPIGGVCPGCAIGCIIGCCGSSGCC